MAKVLCPVCEGEGRQVEHALDKSCRDGVHEHCEAKGQCTSCQGLGEYEDDMEDD